MAQVRVVLNNLQHSYEAHVEKDLRAAADHGKLTPEQLEASVGLLGKSAAQ
jgi:hypothetical protein